MRRVMLGLLSGSIFGGCNDFVTDLASMEEKHIAVYLNVTGEQIDGVIFLEEPPCAHLGSTFRGALNGMPLDVASFGGVSHWVHDGQTVEGCDIPRLRWHGSAPKIDGTDVITIADKTETVTLHVDGLVTPRMSLPSSSVHAGDTVSLYFWPLNAEVNLITSSASISRPGPVSEFVGASAGEQLQVANAGQVDLINFCRVGYGYCNIDPMYRNPAMLFVRLALSLKTSCSEAAPSCEVKASANVTEAFPITFEN